MTARNFSNNANAPVLTAGISALATVLSTSTISNWPAAPCYATIELDGSSPEVVQVTSIGSGTMTVIRAQGGTSAAIHDAGIAITHTAVALDYSEANTHVNASTGVHGATGAVVGTTDTQTLTNKTLTSPGLDTVTVRASSSAPGSINKAAATGTQDISQWATSAGVVLAKVDINGSVQAPTVVAAGTSTSSTPVTAKGASGQTAKLLSLQTNLGVEQFGVDKLGKARVAPLTDEATALVTIKMPGNSANPIEVRDAADTIKWRVGALGDQIVTGLSLQDNGFFDKANTADGKFRVDPSSNVVMSGAKITLDATQANNVPTSPNKLGKRMHWNTLSGTTDGSGYLVVTHGAGFTPSVVQAMWTNPGLGGGPAGIIGVDSIGATTFRLRMDNGVSLFITGNYVCYE